MEKYSINKDGFMKSSDIEVKFIEYGLAAAEHSHNSIELVFIVDGKGFHTINNKKYFAERGTVLLMDSTCTHQFEPYGCFKYYNVLFNGKFLSDKLKEKATIFDIMKYYNYDCKETEVYTKLNESSKVEFVENLLFNMLSEGVQKSKNYLSIVRDYLEILLNTIFRNSETTKFTYDEVMEKAIEYISENCYKNLTLEAVANKFNYNPVYFSNKLKKYCGISYKQMIMKKRMNKAILELWNTDKKLEDIIFDCGFSNKSEFYRMFQSEFAVRPKFIREYKKNWEKYIEKKVYLK